MRNEEFTSMVKLSKVIACAWKEENMSLIIFDSVYIRFESDTVLNQYFLIWMKLILSHVKKEEENEFSTRYSLGLCKSVFMVLCMICVL